MHWVFAYGSNMHLADLRRWLRAHDYPEAGVLEAHAARILDHTLVWNYFSRARAGAAANVTRAQGEMLYGVALRVDDTLLAAIDHKEGHPERYSRGADPHPAELLGDSRRIPSWLYTVTPRYIESRLLHPRRDYLELMLEGAAQHGLPEPWLQHLRSIPTMEDTR